MKDDLIGEITLKLLEVLEKSSLSNEDKKKALYRAEGRVGKVIPIVKKRRLKKSKKITRKKKRR